MIGGLCQTLAENVLKHVTNCIKKIILEAKEHLELHEDQGLYNVWKNMCWDLGLLLMTESVEGLVENTMEESSLSKILQKLSVSY